MKLLLEYVLIALVVFKLLLNLIIFVIEWILFKIQLLFNFYHSTIIFLVYSAISE